MVERFEVGNYYKMVSNSNNVGRETFIELKNSPHQLERITSEYESSVGENSFCTWKDLSGSSIGFHYEASDFVLVQKGKKGKVIKESPIRYMVYGTGCENKGTLVLTEKELKNDLTNAVNNRSWTGRIIGYK